MPPIKFRERLTKFMISISLSEKFCCQNLITSIKVNSTSRYLDVLLNIDNNFFDNMVNDSIIFTLQNFS